MIKALLVDSEWKLSRFLEGKEYSTVRPDTPSKIERLKLEFFSNSLFGKKDLLLKSIDKWEKEERNWLMKNLSSYDRNIFITSEDPDLIKKFGFEDLSSPKQWDINGWMEEIENICRFFGVKIDEKGKELILNRTWNIDLMAKEIEKISIFSKTPSYEDIEKIVPSYSAPFAFDFYRRFFERDPSSLKSLRDLIQDIHPMIILRGLEKMAITVGKLLSDVKTEYSWDDVKQISKSFSIPIPQVADLVGFPLGGKKRKNILQIWDYEKINGLIEDFQDAEIRIKNGNDPFFEIINLVSKWVKGGVL
ncbi:MAG: hypothetical protein ACP5F2_05015 [Athalassotoga sp.]|uniref:hypothetical protein n=1 Tax=Athalassotoga sp. TaxID=2022597 RepID=UPI003D041B93